MSQRTYPVGTAQVPLVMTVNQSGPVTGLTITARIIVPWVGLGFDFADNSFKPVGSLVQPTVILAAATTPGVYYALWNTSGIIADAETIVVYECASPAFIQDDPVSFQTSLTGGGGQIVNAFVEAMFDSVQNTLTIVGGIKNGESGLIASTDGIITVKDELNNLLLSQTTTSLTGFHRAVFPNPKIPPNRILFIFADFTVGASTFSTVETLAVLGKAVA